MAFTKPLTVEELFASGTPGAHLFFNRDSQVGAKFEGEVVEALPVQARNYDDNTPKWWDIEETQPMMQLSITLATTLRSRDIEDDNGHRRYFCPWWGPNRNALTAAVQNAGDKYVRVGAHMSIKFAGLGEQKDRKLNAPKLFEFTYRQPASETEKLMTESAPAVTVTKTAPTAGPDLVAIARQAQADAAAKAAAVAPPAPAAAPATNGAGADLVKVKNLLAAGIDAATITALMPHISMDMISAISVL